MLTWKRTRIGGEDLHHDFTAFHGDRMVGRIMRIDGGPQAGRGKWFFLLAPSGKFLADHDTGGTEETRQQAIDRLVSLVEIWAREFPEDAGRGGPAHGADARA